jgi:hypothetical protein
MPNDERLRHVHNRTETDMHQSQGEFGFRPKADLRHLCSSGRRAPIKA